jgi:multidrug efflux pump subunit AcrA (membrane-fusion protein)
MKRRTIIVGVIIVAAVIGVFIPGRHNNTQRSGTVSETAKDLYYCPMHPNFTSDKPGNCGICGMTLVKRAVASPAEQEATHSKSRKILFYRNPMNPEVTSPVPMKDQMGMDYVPVYEQEATNSAMVYISPEKQQLIGVKKGKVQKRNLAGQILTVGRVAYDPALFVAQEEYLQAVRFGGASQGADSNYKDEQSGQLVNAVMRKLILLGMSEEEISALRKEGKPQQNLYLPGKNDRDIWVYANIYEYEAGLVKTGGSIEVETTAYPGQSFKGTVVSVAPVLDATTRSLKVRALVENPENKLKPEMFVNAKINYGLGEKLAAPEEAVMHAGTRDIVFVAGANGHFESRVVKLGHKAEGYYEVLEGLAENEEVVTSGNFLVDSESKLNAVLNKSAEPNK